MMKQLFGKIGIAIVVVFVAVAFLGIPGIRSGRVDTSDEWHQIALSQARKAVSTEWQVKRLSFVGESLEEDAGEYICDSVPYYWERFQMLNDMMDFPGKEPRTRRAIYREAKGVQDTSALWQERLDWMRRFQGERPGIKNQWALHDAFIEAKERYNEAVSRPARLLTYDVRVKGASGLFRAYFVSPVDSVKLKLVLMEPLTIYNMQ